MGRRGGVEFPELGDAQHFNDDAADRCGPAQGSPEEGLERVEPELQRKRPRLWIADGKASPLQLFLLSLDQPLAHKPIQVLVPAVPVDDQDHRAAKGERGQPDPQDDPGLGRYAKARQRQQGEGADQGDRVVGAEDLSVEKIRGAAGRAGPQDLLVWALAVQRDGLSAPLPLGPTPAAGDGQHMNGQEEGDSEDPENGREREAGHDRSRRERPRGPTVGAEISLPPLA